MSVPVPSRSRIPVRDLEIREFSAHRLLRGDLAIREDVDRLAAGEVADLSYAYPPYNVRVELRSNNATAAGLSLFGSLVSHPSFALHRGVSKAKRTTERLRPDGCAVANDFIKDADCDVLRRQWVPNLEAAF